MLIGYMDKAYICICAARSKAFQWLPIDEFAVMVLFAKLLPQGQYRYATKIK